MKVHEYQENKSVLPSSQSREPVSKPLEIKPEGKSPLQAMKEMKGKENISRHELAEEAIRQHFRDLQDKIKDDNELDRLV